MSGELKLNESTFPVDWSGVRRVLIVRLRSIGDTVLITPALRALREFLPEAQIDVLLEDWVAPLLDGHEDVDRVIAIDCKNLASRLRVGRSLRRARYDVAFNLHAGTTAALLVRASGATHRIGYHHSRLKDLHNIIAPPADVLWGSEIKHTAARHLALLKWTGVPLHGRRMPSRLAVTGQAVQSVEAKLRDAAQRSGVRFDETTEIALVHPAAAFASKCWATKKFACVIEHLHARGLVPVVVSASNENRVLAALIAESSVPALAFPNMSLPEVTALANRARIFLGNDSGVAHVAAAVSAPSVVIFGSSNPAQWSPWTDAPAEVVTAEDIGSQNDKEATDDPSRRIERITVEQVVQAVERVLDRSDGRARVADKVQYEQYATF